MRKRLHQFGQGMTEYIIIVALIAIAAIAVYGFFGDAIRAQMGAMTQELAGEQGDTSAAGSYGSKAEAEGAKERTLKDYTGN